MELTHFDSFEDVPELGADECAAGVGSVDVEPEFLPLADLSDLQQVVKRTDSRCS